MTYRNYLNIFFFIFIAISLLSASASFAGQYVVIKVYDGDTTMVDRKGKKYEIRFAGIVAPEDDQLFGKEATNYLTNLCLDHIADIKPYGTDQ